MKILLLSAFIAASINLSFSKTIHKEQSLYRNIIVTKNGQKLCMKFSLRRDRKQNQSCKMLDNPDFLVFDYAKLAVAGFLMADKPKNILVIGLGGGTLIESFNSLEPDSIITSVEIDPAVVKVAKQYFHLPVEPWHNIIEKDGRIFIKREKIRGAKYDLIVLDAFNGDYIPEHLMTLEFFKEVKSILSNDGLVVSNTFSSSILYDYESSTYHKAFGGFYQLKGKFSGNRVIVTGNKKLPSKEEFKRITLKYKSFIEVMDIKPEYLWRALEVNPVWNKNSPVLTDDFAPVNILKH